MIREIKKKMVILSGRKPFSPAVKEFIASNEKKDWVYRNMRLEGSALRPEQVENLLRGEYVLGASVFEHLIAERLENLLVKMKDFLSRGADIDLKLINTFHNIISGTADDLGKGYRKRSISINEYNYTPVIPAEIAVKMAGLQNIVNDKIKIHPGSEENFQAAAEIHNEILKIFPYGEDDKILARVVMTYFIMSKGYPAAIPDMSESEYNEIVFDGLKCGDCKGLKEMLMKAVIDRTDFMIQLTAY